MSKKTIFTGLFGIINLLILVFPVQTFAAQYYDQYPGNGFIPSLASSVYFRGDIDPPIYNFDTNDGSYICPVQFNVPDGSTYFIKSIGIRYRDNLDNGRIHIYLTRQNLYTGAIHTVAEWSSGLIEAISSTQTASKGTESGVKLVDTKKFVYWLNVLFWVSGDVNPSTHLQLHQVRIHYGT